MSDEVRRGPGRPPRRPSVAMPTTTKPRTPVDSVANALPEQRMTEAAVVKPTVVKARVIHTQEDAVLIEKWRWLKGRVKRTGGLVKDMHDDEIAKAEAMLKELDRTADQGWPNDVYIEGYDNASHADNQKHLYEKTVKMVTV